MKTSPTALVFGEFYSPNLGDGVIYRCEEKLFADCGVSVVPVDLSGRPGWETIVDQEMPEKVGFLHKLAGLAMPKSRTLRRMYSCIRWFLVRRRQQSRVWQPLIQSADAVVIGGGQLLTDMNFGFALRIHEVARLARRNGKPLAFFGCGVGLNGWDFITLWLYRSALKHARYVSVRDNASAQILKPQLKVSCRFGVHPDPAFYVDRITANRQGGAKPDCIGFNIQPAQHFRSFVPRLSQLSDLDYLDFWFKLIRDACAAGNSAIVLTNGEPLDYAVALRLVGKLADNGISVELGRRPQSPGELLEQLAGVSRLVCTRMHAGIIAYGLGANVAAISWDKKVVGVWQAVGLGGNVVPPEVLLLDDPWEYFLPRIGLVKEQPASLTHAQEQIVISARACMASLGLAQ
tara:strand:- start:4705 stop:5916 length:1212 start_codon:yes stop_codon:yes gene_type:complete